MDLTERYLSALERCLPKNQRDDIIEELGESIRSQMEEKAAALGRPLTLDEESELLKAYGHPLIVANRYGTQPVLIGPALLPFYYYTLRVLLTIVLIVAIFAAFATRWTAANALEAFAHFWAFFWTSGIFTVGIVTIIFAVMERFGPDVAWNPRTLPPVAKPGYIPRSKSIAELVTNVTTILYVLVPAVRYPVAYLFSGPGAGWLVALPFAFTPIWAKLEAVILAAFAINAAMNIVNVLRPQEGRLRAIVLLVTNATWVGISAVLLRAGTLVTVLPKYAGVLSAQRGAAALSSLAYGILAIVLIACVIGVALNLRTLIRPSGRSLQTLHPNGAQQ